jgi:hypothetical protein
MLIFSFPVAWLVSSFHFSSPLSKKTINLGIRRYKYKIVLSADWKLI